MKDPIDPTPWEGEREEIPRGESALRFWYERMIRTLSPERSFIRPVMVKADTLDELKEKVAQIRETLGRSDSAIILPQFYADLFGLGPERRDHEPEVEGPYEVVLFVDSDDAARAIDVDGVVKTGMPLPRGPILRESPHEPPSPFRSGMPRRKIERIVAVIDSDVAWAQQRFRNSAGKTTRIDWFWDMNADRFDSVFNIGHHMSGKDIDSYLATLGPGVGEMQLYERYAAEWYATPTRGLPPAQQGHGTEVLDAAIGGNVLSDDDATMIVAIQLPRFAVALTHGYFLDLYIRLALDWIHALALACGQGCGRRGGFNWIRRRFGWRPPHKPEVLVNMSVGGSAGRHDGLSAIERAMDERLQAGRLSAVFLPAGNDFEGRMHASFRAKDMDFGDLVWRIPPDDGTPNFLEIWLPDDRDDPLGLELELPMGLRLSFSAGILKPGFLYPIGLDGVTVAGVFVFVDGASASDQRRGILIGVRQTALLPAQFGFGWRGIPELAGDWRLRLVKHALGESDLVELWIARDDEIFRASTKARQSFFPDYGPAHLHVTTTATLSDYASGKRTTVCAAHTASSRIMTRYSAQGANASETVSGSDVVPTLSHAADVSLAHPGTAAAGFFSGSMRLLSGTSVAAPQVMRGQILKGPVAGGQTIRDRARTLAEQNEQTYPEASNPVLPRQGPDLKDFGGGRLHSDWLPPDQHGATGWPLRRFPSIRARP